MAGPFDKFFGGGGGNMFGGNSLYADMLTPEQLAAVRQQSMMQVAAKLLESSGPSPVRRTLGQTLGGALSAGAEAMQTGQTNAVQQMLLKQKLDEAKLTAKQREDFNAMLTGQGTNAPLQPSAPLTASQALLAPAGGRTGPTPQNAAMIGQQVPAPVAQMSASSPAAQQSVFQMLSPQQRQLIASQGPVEGSKTLFNMTQEAMKFGSPTAESRGGRAVLVSRNPFGQERIVDGAQPYEALPSDIRGTEYVYGQPLAGTGQSGMTRLGQYGTATKPPSNVVLPTGPNQFVQGLGSGASTMFIDATKAANSANSTLQTIDRIAPALDKAVLGVGADYQTTMLRVADKLGIGGPDNAARLSNTRQVVQGLAQAELDAASAMRGQGALSDSERGLLRRAAIGDQTMTAGELTTAMAAMQKIARQRLEDHRIMFEKAGGIQGVGPMASMFQVTPYQSQFDLGGSLNTGANQGLGNAVQQEIDRRRGSGGAR